MNNDDFKQTSQVLGEVSAQAEQAAKSMDKVVNKTEELTTDFEKAKASSSAALGVLSSVLAKTNPILSTTVGSLQKMVPMILDIAKAAKTAGATAKSAIASTGIGLAVVAVTELYNIISKIVEKHKEQQKEAHLAYLEEQSLSSELSWQLELLNARGASTTEILETEQALAQAEYDVAHSEAQSYRDKIANLEKVNKLQAWRVKRSQEYKDALAAEEEATKKLTLANVRLDAAKNGGKPSPSGGGDTETTATDYSSALKASTLNALKKSLTEAEATLALLDEGFNKGLIGLDEYSEASQKLKDQIDDLRNSINGFHKDLIDTNSSLPDLSTGVTLAADTIAPQAARTASAFEQWKQSQQEAWDAMSDEDKLNTALTGIDSVASSLATISTAYENNLNTQLSTGKISEKEYKRQMKVVKAMQIAETTISTLTGAIDAYKSLAGIPYVGPALGAAAAAAITTAGAINIAQIKNTDISGENTTPAVTVSPAPQTYQLNTASLDTITSAQNATTEAVSSVQPVLVVEDLNQVQSQVSRVKVQSEF